MTLEEILALPASDAIELLKQKEIDVPGWEDRLKTEYTPSLHPVTDKSLMQDRPDDDGTTFPATRITSGLAQLAVNRIVGLCFGIPTKRIYEADEDTNEEKLEQAQKLMERIYKTARINSVNIKRWKSYFAACEMATLWFSVEGDVEHNKYGVPTKIKIRNRTYSPMDGDELYPLFDSTGDMIAMSIGTTVKVGDNEVKYFDTYTSTLHIQWVDQGNGWVENPDQPREALPFNKIPIAYAWRQNPIWGDGYSKITEIEWVLSRIGNYLRSNLKPILAIMADEEVPTEQEDTPEAEDKAVVQLPKGSDMRYVTWQMAYEAIQYFNSELRNSFFTEIQIPDLSYENMKNLQLSGEAFKQIFVDAILKVIDEQGDIVEFLDREYNVLVEIAKIIEPALATELDALRAETKLTPFSISSESDEIKNLLLANGNKPILSHRESVVKYGYSTDVDKTMEAIQADSLQDGVNQHL